MTSETLEALPSTIPFGRRHIGAAEPVLVIAEIGINHEGDAGVCARMIEAAVAAGADVVKLQTVDADRNYAPDTESYRLFKGAELSREATAEMFALARRLGAEVFSTSGDLATLDWVDRLNPAGHKISSGLLTCTPLISRAARTGRPLLMSTGMATIDDIDAAVETARTGGAAGVGLFQCTSLYPAPPETLGLGAIGWLEVRYGLPAGYSDHSCGFEAPPLAVAAGAAMLEKHFSLDPSRPGFDHQVSLGPCGFRAMVEAVRRAQVMRGRQEKVPSPQLQAIRRRMSRYLGVVEPVEAGEILDEKNLGFLRLPEDAVALPASAFDEVVGARAVRRLEVFTPITKSEYMHG